MIKLRIQYINEEEYTSAISKIQKAFKILTISKPIKNRNHLSYRVYIEVI